MNSKAQISVEFIIVLILLFVLFLFSVFVFYEKNTGFTYSKENHEARLLADNLARTINSVYLSGNGSEARVFLEKKFDFSLTISGNAARVGWRDNFVDSALVTDNVTVNSLSAGNWIQIRNENGGIQIENN